MSLLLIAALLCALIQTVYSIDGLGIFLFIAISIVSLLFSLLFAWLQIETQNSYLNTGALVSFSSLCLVILTYTTALDGYMSINMAWGDISMQLDVVFWSMFLLPFIGSVLTYVARTRLKTLN